MRPTADRARSVARAGAKERVRTVLRDEGLAEAEARLSRLTGRFAEIRRILADAAAAEAGHARATLEARARLLARPRPAAARDETRVQLLTFRVGEERCAFPLADVLEVVRLGEFSRIPRAPRPLAGIAQVRGALIAALDLGPRLGVTPGPSKGGTPAPRAESARGWSPDELASPMTDQDQAQTRLVLLGRGRPEAAVLAAEPFEITSCPGPALAASPPPREGSMAPVRATLADGLMVLDAAALLEDKTLWSD